MIQIYYGSGKGKTTAALGAGLRACGAGLSVSMVQFLKSSSSSELKSAPFYIYPSPDAVPFEFDEESFEEYKEWLFEAFRFVRECSSDVIILDEALDLVSLGFVSGDDIASFLCDDKEYIITGHEKCSEVFDKADYISKIECERHPYYSGVKARKGFEF